MEKQVKYKPGPRPKWDCLRIERLVHNFSFFHLAYMVQGDQYLSTSVKH